MREIKFRAWDGNTMLGYKQHGYVKRKANNHPHADKRGYVMEHRLVMENHLGSYLPKHAIIHHKNGIRDDNRLENLEYMPEQERHAKHHDSGKRNSNGQFVAQSSEFSQKKFRLLNKNTGLMQEFTLAKLISTTFRKSQFEYRGEFTGLKDKNGKEIFENDILKHPEYGNCKVIYRYGGFGIEAKTSSWINTGFHSFSTRSADYEHCEVLGNLYENSNLLSQDK